MTDPRLARLARLAGLIRDARLARLAESAAEVAALEARIAALPDVAEPADDPAEALAALRHLRWAAERRAALAAERATLLLGHEQAKVEARTALSRAEVLERLAARGRGQLS